MLTAEEGDAIQEALLAREWPTQWLIMVGNPRDGVQLIGPFASYDEADWYLEHCVEGYDDGGGWIMETEAPMPSRILE